MAEQPNPDEERDSLLPKADDESKAAEKAKEEAPPQRIKRLKSLESHRELMSEHMQKFWEENYKLMNDPELQAAQQAAVMQIGQGGQMSPDQVNALKTQAQEAMKQSLMREGTLEGLYTDYDKNKDGVLDKEELKKLMGDYLKTNKTWAPDMVKKQFEVSQQLAQGALGGMVGEEDGAEEMMAGLAAMQAQMMGAMMESTIKAAENIADGLMKDLDDFSAELFELLDTNKDGKIQKDEFLNGFIDCMGQVFAPEKMLKYAANAMGDIMGDVLGAALQGAGDGDDDCLIM